MPAQSIVNPSDPGQSLALALVTASVGPLLLIDGDLKIIAASGSFSHAFGLDPKTVAGSTLTALGVGEWRVPQLGQLLQNTADGVISIDAYEMDLKRSGQADRRLVINVQKIAYGEPDKLRLLVAISDVTDSRLATKKDQDQLRANAVRNDELAIENQALMEEIKHRVANSLQIIASVLMQNARSAQSEEARNQLRDAHARVMSIADLQHQLAGATTGTVALRTYLTKLCATIAASMIPDPNRLSLEVVAEDVTVDGGVSLSIGLVVTELVINALKHAFTDDRAGKITVDYQTEGPMWTLSVADTGVGMPSGPPATSGLGTSIIQALARQLGARVDLDDMNPGTKVSLVHTPVAPVIVDADPSVKEKAV
ncbi:sensor histidine kinase [Phenylobacterium sp.]|uniref:sensor histidine kinase n=1 Tax=Phenylobacterium sp. TaxID=1871053 RepID=UPI002E37B9F6|nr:histidine kinase dimerization/phosphoacceptor domain -containing protein [Phenylobacterium sp.]HEX3364202.1 histidine kinase dimerization/phosphoacceptor domain -containing protein [Phenylobacterium sp.]